MLQDIFLAKRSSSKARRASPRALCSHSQTDHAASVMARSQNSLAASRQSTNGPEDPRQRLDKNFLGDQFQLLKSLDDQLREDLAQHLLLTFHSNQYYQRTSRIPRLEPAPEEDLNQIEEPEKPKQNYPVPSLRRRWRAWPLPRHQTPRLEIECSSSDSLHQCLVAALLRSAAAKMNNREDAETFSADDETSSKICFSTSQHIMASLDKLLIGIYQSKEGYAANEAVQDVNSLFRKRRQRGGNQGDLDEEDVPSTDHVATKKQKLHKSYGSHSISQVYKQGSQRLLSAADILQHGMIQSVPRSVLQRASKRLEILLRPPPDIRHEHNKYLTLTESKHESIHIGFLDKYGDNSAHDMEFASYKFLGTDVERVQVGDKQISRSVWEAWDESKVQVAEAGCFDRDGFLEEIPGPGRTNENRRRKYRNKRSQELESHHS
ncbi:hypothetical protein AA313_de0200964 [Arthrobotrys entomopaga]|nr:hypothetical protein AA313_de0200964 [Arthrobotrys entomopaga]